MKYWVSACVIWSDVKLPSMDLNRAYCQMRAHAVDPLITNRPSSMANICASAPSADEIHQQQKSPPADLHCDSLLKEQTWKIGQDAVESFIAKTHHCCVLSMEWGPRVNQTWRCIRLIYIPHLILAQHRDVCAQFHVVDTVKDYSRWRKKTVHGVLYNWRVHREATLSSPSQCNSDWSADVVKAWR